MSLLFILFPGYIDTNLENRNNNNNMQLIYCYFVLIDEFIHICRLIMSIIILFHLYMPINKINKK